MGIGLIWTTTIPYRKMVDQGCQWRWAFRAHPMDSGQCKSFLFPTLQGRHLDQCARCSGDFGLCIQQLRSLDCMWICHRGLVVNGNPSSSINYTTCVYVYLPLPSNDTHLFVLNNFCPWPVISTKEGYGCLAASCSDRKWALFRLRPKLHLFTHTPRLNST